MPETISQVGRLRNLNIEIGGRGVQRADAAGSQAWCARFIWRGGPSTAQGSRRGLYQLANFLPSPACIMPGGAVRRLRRQWVAHLLTIAGCRREWAREVPFSRSEPVQSRGIGRQPAPQPCLDRSARGRWRSSGGRARRQARSHHAWPPTRSAWRARCTLTARCAQWPSQLHSAAACRRSADCWRRRRRPSRLGARRLSPRRRSRGCAAPSRR